MALPPMQVTWDGHSGSMARTQQAAQANITLQEQIEAIHKAKGLVPEDDTKEKIGPSKPNEIPQQPPPPSSATNIPSSAPPITSVPRPPAVSPQPPRTGPWSWVPRVGWCQLRAAVSQEPEGRMGQIKRKEPFS